MPCYLCFNILPNVCSGAYLRGPERNYESKMFLGKGEIQLNLPWLDLSACIYNPCKTVEKN